MIYFKFYYYDSIRSVPINKVFIFMVFLIPFFVFLLTMNHSLVFFFFAFFPHSSGVGIFSQQFPLDLYTMIPSFLWSASSSATWHFNSSYTLSNILFIPSHHMPVPL
uniref:Uncharacterized protein n=1 Tax=Cacopsylla melanoneura TaxID=428564 RepID=A0A8D8U808_9HEMI